MGADDMILVFWMLSFKPTFPHFSFTLIERLFSSSLSAIRVVSSAYLRLLMFLLAILILACPSPSLAFRMRWPKYWSFSFNISLANEHSGLITFRMDWLNLLAVPGYLTSMQSTSWETLGWKKHKLASRLPGEASITSDTQMTPPLCRKRRTEEPLDESEIGEWKSWLKTQHSKN